MRFTKEEYDQLVAALQKKKLEESEFNFVKSKGNIKIDHVSTGQSFTFYRDEKTTLDKNGQWDKEITYYESSRKKIKIGSLEQLLTGFGEWIAGNVAKPD